MTRGERAAAAALAGVGVRFRLHGRGGAGGLDCVGVAAAAARAAGCGMPVPGGYRLRGGEATAVAAMLDAWLPRGDAEAVGALMLMRPGAGQLHLGIGVGSGLGRGMVHADAGLGRVVMRPGPPAWPVVGAWGWGD